MIFFKYRLCFCPQTAVALVRENNFYRNIILVRKCSVMLGAVSW
jgi:hypothetical protein